MADITRPDILTDIFFPQTVGHQATSNSLITPTGYHDNNRGISVLVIGGLVGIFILTVLQGHFTIQHPTDIHTTTLVVLEGDLLVLCFPRVVSPEQVSDHTVPSVELVVFHTNHWV